MLAYINGEFVKDERVSIRDLGFLRGYGVFEYLRTYNGKLFHLKEHLKRLEHSAEMIGIKLPKSLAEIGEIAETLVINECTIRIIVTGGISPDGITPVQSALYVMMYPLVEQPRQPIRLMSTSLQRFLPEAKTLNYISAIMALKDAQGKGAHEALYVSESKEILETTTSNIFFVKGNRIITSDSSNILRGITRAIVMRLAQDDFLVEQRPIFYDELGTFEEAFTTSSIKEIVTISQIDSHNFEVGPKIKRLNQLYYAYTSSGSWNDLSMDRPFASIFS